MASKRELMCVIQEVKTLALVLNLLAVTSIK